MKYLEFFIFTFFSEIQSIPQGFEVEFLAQSKCQDKMEKTGFTCTNGNFEKSTCLKNDSVKTCVCKYRKVLLNFHESGRRPVKR